jgi:hypothetical protein
VTRKEIVEMLIGIDQEMDDAKEFLSGYYYVDYVDLIACQIHVGTKELSFFLTNYQHYGQVS